jgi:2-methylisocitrate lyase-like PEP mutase family enzyme
VTDQRELAARFLADHHAQRPLLLPNPWDAGSARILASLGFDALATTSSGHAATLGRLDGAVTRTEAIQHAAAIAAAVALPVSADLENAFADDPDGVAATIEAALGAGLAGCSIEDWSGEEIYPLELAAERVAAAAVAAHAGGVHLVLTARAENHVHDRDDLDDTIARLQAFEAAGADVLYPTGLTALEDIRRVVAAVGAPVNVLVRPGAPSVAELAQAGVARISIGGAFAFASVAALVDAANEFREQGTYSFLSRAAAGSAAVRAAFS